MMLMRCSGSATTLAAKTKKDGRTIFHPSTQVFHGESSSSSFPTLSRLSTPKGRLRDRFMSCNMVAAMQISVEQLLLTVVHKFKQNSSHSFPDHVNGVETPTLNCKQPEAKATTVPHKCENFSLTLQTVDGILHG